LPPGGQHYPFWLIAAHGKEIVDLLLLAPRLIGEKF